MIKLFPREKKGAGGDLEIDLWAGGGNGGGGGRCFLDESSRVGAVFVPCFACYKVKSGRDLRRERPFEWRRSCVASRGQRSPTMMMGKRE